MDYPMNIYGMVHFVFQGVASQNFYKVMYLSLEIVFILANSVDPDEMPP